jgi:RND family efflux transporter MFP subunit
MDVSERGGPVKGSVARGMLVTVVVIAAVCGIAWWGIASRAKAMVDVARETRELAVPTVSVVRPGRQMPQDEVVLPGSMQAFIDAPIYARTSGYLRRRTVDIGAHVKMGQLLAEIDAPELGQQLEQARADLSTAEANARLAQVTADRYTDLMKTDSVSQQDVDNAKGALDARNAAVDSARHNVQRLDQLQAFTKIYAPFDGTITVRNTDVGALIDSGASGGAARELFHIAATDRLRVFVNLPEVYSRAARPEMAADLVLAEFPGRRFAGRLARTADAIDSSTRTLLVEIDVDNGRGELLPGSYAEVHLKLPSPTSTFLLPVTTVLFRSEGVQVATVRGGDRVALVPVTLGRDFGTEVEVLSGLTGDELIVANPPDSLAQDQIVRLGQPAAPAGRGGSD